jgi:hypothetical protein
MLLFNHLCNRNQDMDVFSSALINKLFSCKSISSCFEEEISPPSILFDKEENNIFQEELVTSFLYTESLKSLFRQHLVSEDQIVRIVLHMKTNAEELAQMNVKKLSFKSGVPLIFNGLVNLICIAQTIRTTLYEADAWHTLSLVKKMELHPLLSTIATIDGYESTKQYLLPE